MSEKLFTLYGLKRPDENQIRYIGITSETLDKRLYRHVLYSGYNSHKDRWIKKMFPLKPEIIPYAVGLTKEEACDLEIFVIAELRKLGLSLLNITDGGEHMPDNRGRVRSPEYRRLSSMLRLGKRPSIETRLKMRHAKLGKKHTLDARANMVAAWRIRKGQNGI